MGKVMQIDYSCINCGNLKEQLITKNNLKAVSKYKILKGIKENSLGSLGLTFPLNKNAYKRVRRQGKCKIVYCNEYLLRRDLYILRDTFDIRAIYPYKNKPCPKYK